MPINIGYNRNAEIIPPTRTTNRSGVFAISQFQSGFKHGVADAALDNTNRSGEDYIHQSGNSMDHHTLQFNNGYIYGWCSVQGINSGKETDDADFDCEDYLSH